MSLCEMIPVLDVRHGAVVRGVAGDRSRYRPVVSQWADGADPLAIARMFRARFGLESLYIADLDGLVDASPQWDMLSRLIDHGFTITADIGLRNLAQATRLAEMGVDRVVVALESLNSWTLLEEVIAPLGTERVVFSLDLMGGVPRLAADSSLPPDRQGKTQSPQQLNPHDLALAFARCAIGCGLSSLIVLDVAAVGVARGIPTLDLCRSLRTEWPELTMITGGGVRTLDDVSAAREAGANGVLIASALHDGAIQPTSVRPFVDDCAGHGPVPFKSDAIDAPPVDPESGTR